MCLTPQAKVLDRMELLQDDAGLLPKKWEGRSR